MRGGEFGERSVKFVEPLAGAKLNVRATLEAGDPLLNLPLRGCPASVHFRNLRAFDRGVAAAHLFDRGANATVELRPRGGGRHVSSGDGDRRAARFGIRGGGDGGEQQSDDRETCHGLSPLSGPRGVRIG